MARAPNRQVEAATYYGGVKPIGVVNGDAYRTHDPISTWNDDGIANDLVTEDLARLQQTIADALEAFKAQQVAEQEAYGRHQVRDAIYEYGASAIADIGLIGGRAVVAIDLSSDGAEFRPYYDLEEMVTAAITGAQRGGDRQMLSALHGALSNTLAAVGSGQPEMPGARVKRDVEMRRLGVLPEPPPAGQARSMSRRAG